MLRACAGGEGQRGIAGGETFEKDPAGATCAVDRSQIPTGRVELHRALVLGRYG